MALILYLIFCWLIIAMFITQKPKLNNQQNAFLLIIISIFSTHTFVLLSAHFKLIELSKDDYTYIAFLLYRSIYIPFLLTLFINFFYKAKAIKVKLVIIIISCLVFFILEKLNLYLDLYHYQNWSSLFTISLLIVLLFIALGLLKVFTRGNEHC